MPQSCIWTVPVTDLQLTCVYVKELVEPISVFLPDYKAVVAHGETEKKPPNLVLRLRGGNVQRHRHLVYRDIKAKAVT